MSDLLKGRKFQFWEYIVNHGHLLIRSPSNEGFSTNIDITFAGVEYVMAPRHFDSIRFDDPSASELADIKARLRLHDYDKLWVLVDGTKRAIIVAAHMRVEEIDGDYMTFPLRNRQLGDPRLHWSDWAE